MALIIFVVAVVMLCMTIYERIHMRDHATLEIMMSAMQDQINYLEYELNQSKRGDE